MAPPVLTERQHHPSIANLVVGVGSKQVFIADKIATPIDTNGSSEFEWELADNYAVVDDGPENSSRALRAETMEISQPAESTKKDTVKEWSRLAKIDINEIEADRARDRANPVPAGRMSHEERRYKKLAAKLWFNLRILKERAVASKVFNPNSFTLKNMAAANFAGEAQIIPLMLDTGRTVDKAWLHGAPDTLILGWQSMINLFKNQAILDTVNGGATVDNPANVNLALLAQHFQVQQVVVGKAVTQTEAVPGTPGAVTELWKPNAAALICSGLETVDAEGDPDFGDPDESTASFIKRFYKTVPEELGGGVASLMSYNSLNGKIRFLELTEYWKVILTSSAGYYWDNTNAA